MAFLQGVYFKLVYSGQNSFYSIYPDCYSSNDSLGCIGKYFQVYLKNVLSPDLSTLRGQTVH